MIGGNGSAKGRRLVDRFGIDMKREMDRNAYKGDAWTEADPNELVEDLIYHAFKLARAADSIGNPACTVQHQARQAALEFAADVANMGMMVADNLGILAPGFEPAGSASLGWGGEQLKSAAALAAADAISTIETDPDY